MKEQNKRRFDESFKEGAIRLVEEGRKMADVARELGIHYNLLYRWKKEHQSGRKHGADYNEILKLQKELREVQMERDILKKALSIYSKVKS